MRGTLGALAGAFLGFDVLLAFFFGGMCRVFVDELLEWP
jgi:hypothetical protein